MDPPEPKFLVPDQRLNREIFLLNIDRLRTICVGIYDVMQYVQVRTPSIPFQVLIQKKIMDLI